MSMLPPPPPRSLRLCPLGLGMMQAAEDVLKGFHRRREEGKEVSSKRM